MTEIERNAILNIRITGEETVGDVKDKLKQFKKALDDTTVGSEEYSKAIGKINEAQTFLKSVMEDTKDSVYHAKGSYYALNQELVALRREYKELSEEERNGAIGEETLQRIASLDSELKSLDATMGQYQRNVGHYQLALEALNKDYSSARQELAAMKSAMDNLEPSSEAYAQAFERASKITHDLQERQDMLKYSSKDLGDQLSNVRGIATNMVAGFSAAQAALGLFGNESEEVQQAMLKVQQAMALVQGLQGLDGLIKRTQGLSNALGISSKALKTETVALNADAAATNTQTVATEGATVAQEGLNVAMKANPIGLVIVAVEALIMAWALFKDKIIDALGGQERLNAVMDRAKVIFKGVGNAIVQFLITPVKQFVVGMRTASNVVDKVLRGQFKDAWIAAGEGIKEWGETVKNGFDVVGNYSKAAGEQMAKNAEDAAKKMMEQADKDKDNYIKDQEAKNGSDWKYTEDGKKAYEDMYKNRMNLYDKDTEEYKQAQRDMWSYGREYQDRIDKANEQSQKERAAAAKKAADEIKKNLEKVRSEYQTKVFDYITTETDKARDKAVDRLKSFANMMVSVFGNGAWSNLAASISGATGKSFEAIKAQFDGMKDSMGSYKDDYEKLMKGISNDIAKPIVDKFLESITKMENEMKVAIDTIEDEFNAKEFHDGIEYPAEALQYNINALQSYEYEYDRMVKAVEADMAILKEKNLEDTEAYKQLQLKKTEILNNQEETRLEYAKRESEIRVSYYNSELSEISRAEDRLLKERRSRFDSEKTPMTLFSGVTPKKEKELMQELYQIEMDALIERRKVLEEMANDTGLSFAERIDAQIKLTDTIAEIEDKELQHTIETTQAKIDAWMYYYRIIDDTVSEIGNLIGSLADYYEADLEAKVKNNEMSEKQADAQFENIKKMRIAEATINTIAGAIGAFLQASATYAPPYGQILGGIAAASVTAAGLAEIKKIRSSTRNGSGGGGSSTTYATAAPTITDYAPQGIQNMTYGNEREDLRNALMGMNLSVSVTEINSVQNRVRVREQEATY